jgi:hypothetical protein
LAQASIRQHLANAIAATIAADADPQGERGNLRLAKWLGLEVTTDDVMNLRLALLALLPWACRWRRLLRQYCSTTLTYNLSRLPQGW